MKKDSVVKGLVGKIEVEVKRRVQEEVKSAIKKRKKEIEKKALAKIRLEAYQKGQRKGFKDGSEIGRSVGRIEGVNIVHSNYQRVYGRQNIRCDWERCPMLTSRRKDAISKALAKMECPLYR